MDWVFQKDSRFLDVPLALALSVLGQSFKGTMLELKLQHPLTKVFSSP
jgi:hypothetical protein